METLIMKAVLTHLQAAYSLLSEVEDRSEDEECILVETAKVLAHAVDCDAEGYLVGG